MRKKVAVVFTGGTISMKVDERLAAAVPALSNEEIMSMVTNIDKVADIEVIDFGSYPSPHMSPTLIRELSKIVKDLIKRSDIDGIVITHGTDSLEETAYYLDLNINPTKPIVMVAAMRNNSELGYDGASNLSSAICTAVSNDSINKGVLIVLNNEVNSAREVTKTHTLSLDTFKSLEFGPLGIVDNDEVLFYRNIMKHEHIETDQIETSIELIKTCVGSDSNYMKFAIDHGAKGFVIEAMGRGNVPPEMISGIELAISKNIPVVIVSRCPSGRVLDSYGYLGGGKNLRDLGAIFGGNLNGQKARIKLMLALGKTKDLNEIKSIFESTFYK
ncbi:asparaginase [Fusibacter ferrireducens]|uniref:asparaginase n=1 Tax=Fusibacter ferrireducens TaxID=2785058 RepID=A0ABR9ZU11_9FIRM|nr:asparaginase [Fusibacter ferrireducens]MBF4693831.1 asparaginase [Fusibacter ferrireducens]